MDLATLIREGDIFAAKQKLDNDPRCVLLTNRSNKQTALHELCKYVAKATESVTSYSSHDDDSSCCSSADTELFFNWNDGEDVCQMARDIIGTFRGMGPVFTPDNISKHSNQEEAACYSMHKSIMTMCDHFGNTPLHTLCSHTPEPAILQVFLDATLHHDNHDIPSSVDLMSLQNGHGCTPLHFIAEGRCSFASTKLALRFCFPHELMPISSSNLIGRGTWRATTLDKQHYKNEGINPVLIQDGDGDTALHYACSADISFVRLQLFLEAGAEASLMTNNDGMLPLDELIISHYDLEVDVNPVLWSKMKLLINAAYANCPSSPNGSLYLHAAAGLPTFPIIALKAAYQYNRSDVSLPDKNGNLPLHIAASTSASCPGPFKSPVDEEDFILCANKLHRWSSPQQPLHRVDYLLEKYKQGALVRNGDGRLPLHLAILEDQPLSCITSLVTAAPESLYFQDGPTGLYPFLLAATNSCSLDVVQFLMCRHPEMIQYGADRF